MKAIRIQKIDGQEFVPLEDYKMLEEENKVVGILNDEIRRINENLREENKKLKKEKQELEYLGDINEELKEENNKLKYIIDLVMEKAGIEYIRLADGDVFINPKNKLHISDTIQIDILNGIKNKDERKIGP